MQKEIFDELNRIADGFWTDIKILDRKKLERIDYLQASGFDMQFSKALQNFLKVRKINLNGDPSIDKLLGINPIHDFEEGCEKFLNVVATAKENDLIIDKQVIKELEECKGQRAKLETVLREKEANINTLNKKINQLEAENNLLKRDTQKFTGDVE